MSRVPSMKRLSYAWLLAAAIGFALAPTYAFADPKCSTPNTTCTHGNSDNPTDTCNNNGCTLKNPGHCFDSPDSKCSK
jgi:hypothetical protein